MAKNKNKTEDIEQTVEIINPIEVSEILEKSVVTIIFFANGKDIKEDIEKKVSGNIANILINKGLAKLKN